MKILAIDTATEACSVALCYPLSEPELASSVSANDMNVDGIFEICPQQHSQQILPMIDTLLNKHKLSLSDLDAIAYGRGPGSFTGVRIAASTVQGLALGANLAVIEVSTLATMAQEVYEISGETDIVALIDARMQEVYIGQYRAKDGLVEELIKEDVLSPERALEVCLAGSKSAGAAGTGFGAYADLFAPYLQNRKVGVKYPNAKYMLGIARSMLAAGKVVASEAIKPVYVRDTVTWKKLPGKSA